MAKQRQSKNVAEDEEGEWIVVQNRRDKRAAQRTIAPPVVHQEEEEGEEEEGEEGEEGEENEDEEGEDAPEADAARVKYGRESPAHTRSMPRPASHFSCPSPSLTVMPTNLPLASIRCALAAVNRN